MKLSDRKLQELKEKKISIEDLYKKYLYTEKDGVNVENILKLLNENICSFKQIVDKFKSMYFYGGMYFYGEDSCLDRMLKNKELFEELIQNNRLTKEDLKYLLNRIDNIDELRSLIRNTILFAYIIDKNLLSFEVLVNKHKNFGDLESLLSNTKFLEELIQNNKLNKDDLRYLLKTIDNDDELERVCTNTSLIKEILNEFVLNKEIAEKLNTIIEGYNYRYRNRGIYTIQSIFDYIEYYNKNNEEISKLSELNNKVYFSNIFDLSIDQKLELIEVLRDNEIAKNRLIQIVDNHLEDQYDFESLKSLLTKDNEKKKLKLNV